MKLKKIRSIVGVIGYSLLLLGGVVFFLIPPLTEVGFNYSPLESLQAGVKSLFSFNMTNIIYDFLASLIISATICIIWWAIIAIVRKKYKHLLGVVVSLLGIVFMASILSVYHLTPILFNGFNSVLFKAVLALKGVSLGKILVITVLTLCYVSLMFLTLFVFLDVIILILGDYELPDIEEITVEATEEDVAEFFRKEEPVEVVAPVETFEQRKAREDAYIQACLASGEYQVYYEYELLEEVEGEHAVEVFDSSTLVDRQESEDSQEVVDTISIK